jgi:hypothetical protein
MVAQDGPSPLDAAWDVAQERMVDPTEVLVGPDAGDSCLGQMRRLLRPASAEEIVLRCPHLRRGGGRVPWYRLLEQPVYLRCGRCVPANYLALLRGEQGVHKCGCCGRTRWIAGPARLEFELGTSLAILCSACLEQQAPGVVAVSA